ncbi:hypothetical protein BSLG_004224 [Batrachochytrium salamandrivorans]|nr:hypothetical protein BSLG_004224 [Batrachochytrium salamandrivorans]
MSERLCSSQQQNSSPNGDVGVDAMLSVLAHELAEAVSDPQSMAPVPGRMLLVLRMVTSAPTPMDLHLLTRMVPATT